MPCGDRELYFTLTRGEQRTGNCTVGNLCTRGKPISKSRKRSRGGTRDGDPGARKKAVDIAAYAQRWEPSTPDEWEGGQGREGDSSLRGPARKQAYARKCPPGGLIRGD